MRTPRDKTSKAEKTTASGKISASEPASAPDQTSEPQTASDGSSGPILLPPPVNAAKSVLRSIAALDEAEQALGKGPGARQQTTGERGVAPAIDIKIVDTDAAGFVPGTDAPGKFDGADVGSTGPKTAGSADARKPAEAVKPMRVNAFRPNMPHEETPKARSRGWLRSAAAIAVLLGGGWLLGPHIADGRLPFFGGAETAQLSPLELLKQDTQRLNAEVATLREALARLDSPEARARQLAEADLLRKSLADMTRRLDQARSTQAAVSDFGTRLDRARQEDGKHRDDMAERIARLEKAVTDGRPTASLTPLPQPNSVVPRAAMIQPPPPAGDAPRKPSALTGYILHEVHNGIALIEGRQGFVEAFPGANIPGIGLVQSIVRRGGGWVVVTSNGVIGPRYD